MPYHVAIGYAEPRITRKDGEPEQVASSQYNAVPFLVDTLEGAHLLVALSKSPVWYIEERQDGHWAGKEVVASAMVLRTRELDAQDKAAYALLQKQMLERINSQPKTVTRTYEGITVTIERRDAELRRNNFGRAEAHVESKLGHVTFWPNDYITKSGGVQQAKWRRWVREDWYGLAPHFKEIAALMEALRYGTYKEETAP